ncbi:sensor histidine kinase [Rhodocyclus tenuis]|uniref:sensor histidine kinase n=1 Tax=Rhodocyclus tenuis TaxID=1066 RepID=UPI00190647DD|nr:sensor histidine kinase [Rhodocyclus tenuis]
MELQKRLLQALGGLLGGLLLVTMVINLNPLRADVAAETSASAGLAQTLREVAHSGPAQADAVADSVRLFITLLLLSGATLLAAWWSVQRRLRPLRELEAGLERLVRGQAEAGLPTFRQPEFRRVAGAIDTLAATLASSRAARRQLARQLVHVQEEERRALARELHDEMGQTLTAMNATAAHLERHAGTLPASEIATCAGELRRDLRHAALQLRQMLQALRPQGLAAGELPGALRELVDGWQARHTGIGFHLQLPTSLPPMGDDAALTLYRVVQEALTNVVRHSGARHCAVAVTTAANEIRIDIVDDGCGMARGNPDSGGGLRGMAERLSMAGGHVQANEETDVGLRLSVVLPLTAGANNDGKSQ